MVLPRSTPIQNDQMSSHKKANHHLSSCSSKKRQPVQKSHKGHTQSLPGSTGRQPLHIRMDLTESQMDRLTSAFSRQVDGGSAISPPMLTTSTGTGGNPRLPESPIVNLAERRHRAPPASISTEDKKSAVLRSDMKPIPTRMSPLGPRAMYEACEPTQPEPLRLGNNAPGRRDSKENKHHSPKTPAPKPPPQTPLNMNPVDVPFSPFPFYIGTHDAPSNKRRGKVMIGDKGWLMRTDEEQQPPPAPGRRDSKKTASSILGGIKKIAKDMTEIHHLTRLLHHAPSPGLATKTRPVVSLDAREQSLLYGELEYHMSDVLNGYVTAQLERGRVSTDKLKRVDDAWRTQGRLPVVGFRYDLATQIDLVTMHMDDFEFPGAAWTGGDRRRQHSDCSDQQPCDPIDVLRAVGIDARAMSVRTFCMPDSLVARHIVHAQELFDLVGAEKAKHDALGEIVSFFRLCLDNARAREATKLDEAEQQRRSRARGDPRRPY